MYHTLGKLDSIIPDIYGATEYLQSLEDINLDFIDRFYLQYIKIREGFNGVQIYMALAFENELELSLPGIDFISLTLGSNVPGYTFINSSLTIGSRNRLELHNVQIVLKIKNELLTPVALTPNDSVPDDFEIQLTGSFSIDSELNIDPRLSGFTVPPFMIGRTGLILGLDGCKLDLSSEATPEEVVALGNDESFKGIYAKEAILYWLPQCTFNDVPGLRLIFNDVTLGQTGISLNILQSWTVEHDQAEFLPSTEMKGFIFNEEWKVALSSIKGEVRKNIPNNFFASGMMRIPFLDSIFGVEFSLRQENNDGDEYGFITKLAVFKTEHESIDLNFGSCTITIDQLRMGGILEEDERFSIEGVLGGSLHLEPFHIDLEQANISFSHEEYTDELVINLSDVQFGPLGEIETALLRVKKTINPETNETDLTLVMQCDLEWQNLINRLGLDDLPDAFPKPPDSAVVKAFLSWENSKLVLSFSSEVTDLDNLWNFIPEEYRPEVRQAKFGFEATYNDAASFASSDSNPDSLIEGDALVFSSSVNIYADISLRLPDINDFLDPDLLKIETGDENGWIEAKLIAGMNEEGHSYMKAKVHNPISIDVNIPGMPQPEPPFHTSITAINFELASRDGDVAESFKLTGDFALRPINPPSSFPFSQHLKQLMENIEVSDLTGTTTISIDFKNNRTAMVLYSKFENADIEIDVFDMISNLTRGFSLPANVEEPANSVDLDIDVGFSLKGIELKLGSLKESTDDTELASVKMVMQVHFGAIEAEGFFRLSDKEFALGIAEMEIPLQMPRFPLSNEDLKLLRERPERDGSLWVDSKFRVMFEITLPQKILELQQRNDPKLNKEIAHLMAQQSLLKQIHSIYSEINVNHGVYQGGVELMVGLLDTATGSMHIDTDVKLSLIEFQFVIPFSDPRGISVMGTAKLIGFAHDDPLSGLNDQISMTLGLSADQIYFSLDTTGEPIRLPDFGRYPDGSINVSKLTIGYGYTKNSFAMAFAGELILPPQLIEDADTSESLGIGIRLPFDTKLAFKIDIIPIPGPIPAVPLFDFNLDMRSPISPALTDSRHCTPFWDGFQFIIPDIIQFDIKQIAFSPMFGLLPCPNFIFDGDITMGDKSNGITVIADNMLYLMGVATSPPTIIPLFASPNEPYFDNLCVNFKLAGFGINFNLQRPFPSFNPLALFEVMGLIADPSMEIDPNGELANTIQVSLNDAYIVLPTAVLQMFPEAKEVNSKPINVTINLGTFISAVQGIGKNAGELIEIIGKEDEEISNNFNNLINNPPDLNLNALLNMIPPELRKIRLGGSFAGFDARAVILLIDSTKSQQLITEFEHRDHQPSDSVMPSLELVETADVNELANFRPNLPASVGRTYYPDDPTSSLFAGKEFKEFNAIDLSAIPSPRKPMSGVVVGAYIKVFEGQRYRFLGYLFEDGSFGMISALDINPLELSVAGIAIKLPLEMKGRLIFTGRAKRDGYYGSIWAQGSGKWNVIDKILFVEVGKKISAELKLSSNGKFELKGYARAMLFSNRKAFIAGSVDISQTHFFIDGKFYYIISHERKEVINLMLVVKGRIGPQQHFMIAGEGDLSIFGHPFTKVKGEVSDKGAGIEAHLDTDYWYIAGNRLDCRLKLNLKGMFNLKKTYNPEFELLGDGSLEIFGATIEGKAEIIACNGFINTFIDGNLKWQGREWLNGRIALRSNGYVEIEGRTSFTLDLTPSQLPNGIQLANLLFKIDLSGTFKLNSQGGFYSCNLKVDWTLAVRLSDASNQILPIAMQTFDISSNRILRKKLISIDSINFLPFDNINIPIPKLEVSKKITLYEHDFNIPLIENSTMITPILIDDEKDIPIDLPILGYITIEDMNLNTMISGLNFEVFLAWQNDTLGIEIKKGSHTEFIPLR